MLGNDIIDLVITKTCHLLFEFYFIHHIIQNNTNDMQTNRDIQRVNKGSVLIEGTIFSLINSDGIKAIQNVSNTLLSSDNLQSVNDNTLKNKIKYISSVAEQCEIVNDESLKKMMKCATYIRTGAHRLAYNQNNIIKRAFDNDEVLNVETNKDDNECYLYL